MNMMDVALLCVLVTEMTMSMLTNQVYAQPSNTNFSQMALISCPENCTSCNQTYCFKCKTGYKGDQCELLCSNCGPVTECDKNTGYCSERCRDGMSGNSCNETCDSRCMSCDRLNKNKCFACASGFYGTLCNRTCCLNNTCNGSDGVCTLECSAGYWGHKCEQQCAKCNDNICDKTSGVCLNSCEDGKNGMNCSTSANQNNLASHFTLSTLKIGLISGLGLGVIAIATCVIIIKCKRRAHLRRLTLDADPYDVIRSSRMIKVKVSGRSNQKGER